MTALVFNCHYNGLSIIQELGRHRVPVLALDTYRSVGTFSRYARYHRCPDPQVAEQAFIEDLLKLGVNFDEKPVLFPTNDHWAIAISRYKQELSQYYIPCVADRPTVELIIEKQRFYEWALSKSIPVPRSWRSEQVDSIPQEAFPLVAKPEYRRISSNEPLAGERATTFDSLRLTVLENKAELEVFFSRYHDLIPHFVFQEYVVGLSDCMYTIGVYANQHHEVMGVFSGRKVRGFPPDIGDCIVGQVEAVPQSLKDLVKKICKDINYHGIAEFEFKRDAVSGEFKLIEINPRSWSWVGITPFCGVSLPWMAYCDLTALETLSYLESNLSDGSVKWARVFEDAINCLHRNRQEGFPEWSMTLRQWIDSLQAEQLVIAEFAADDVLPTAYALLSTARKVLRHFRGERNA